MNKKGFTMIELLAVIVILGLLLGVGIPAVNKVLANFRIDYYKKLEGTLATAGQEFISDKRYQKPTELMYSRVITKEELVNGKYIDEILDYKENECAGSYVVVAKIGDKHYEYQACLKCETDEYETDTSNKEYDLCNIAWQDNENIDYGAVNDKEKLWVYYGTPANEIKNELGLSYGITKKDGEGKVLAQAEGMENKIVYPNNINELVSANLDKEVTLRYELPTGESVDRKAEMYRFSVPTVSLKYGANNVATGKNAGDTYTQGEWTSSLNVTIGYNEKDKEKYRDFIEQSTKFTVEWYNQTTKKWEIGATCNTKGLTSCTWNINRDFNIVTKFRIKDYKGHPSMETGNYKLQVDVTKPICDGVGGSTDWTASDRTVTQKCSDALSKCNKNSYSLKYTVSTSTSSIKIYDNAGNESICPVNVYVDKTPPICGTNTGSTTWTKNDRKVTVNCSDSESKCTASTFENTWNTTTKTSSITIKDNVGNTASCPVNVYVDKTPPTCGTKTGSSTSWTKNDRKVKVNCSDSDSKCTASTFENTWNTTTTTSTITIKDNAGNTTSCPVNVYVDKTAPGCTKSYTGNVTAHKVTVSYRCTDSGSGCKTKDDSKTYNNFIKSDKIKLEDKAGNTSYCYFNPYKLIDVNARYYTNSRKTHFYNCVGLSAADATKESFNITIGAVQDKNIHDFVNEDTTGAMSQNNGSYNYQVLAFYPGLKVKFELTTGGIFNTLKDCSYVTPSSTGDYNTNLPTSGYTLESIITSSGLENCKTTGRTVECTFADNGQIATFLPIYVKK